jgi:hypothetical protein
MTTAWGAPATLFGKLAQVDRVELALKADF